MPPRRSSRNTKATQEAEASAAQKREHSPAVSEPEKPGPSKKPRSTAKNGKKKATGKAAEKVEPIEEEPKKEEEAVKEETVEAPQAAPEAKPTTRRRAGATPVDPFSGLVGTSYCFSFVRFYLLWLRLGSHMVFCDPSDGETYAALLNQTNLDGSNNNNKFYVLQLLHPQNDPANCVLFTRWGRVGEQGASQQKGELISPGSRHTNLIGCCLGPFPVKQAILEFKKQFKSKTAAAWEGRKTMVAKKGEFCCVMRRYS